MVFIGISILQKCCWKQVQIQIMQGCKYYKLSISFLDFRNSFFKVTVLLTSPFWGMIRVYNTNRAGWVICQGLIGKVKVVLCFLCHSASTVAHCHTHGWCLVMSSLCHAQPWPEFTPLCVHLKIRLLNTNENITVSAFTQLDAMS